MIAKLLSEALATLKTVAADIGISLDELTAAQLEQYQADCFNKKRLTNEGFFTSRHANLFNCAIAKLSQST